MTTAGLHIEARGAGPAVVFPHGFGRTGDTWARQAEALAGDHHVVTWDLRGHGRSELPPGPYTREDALADLAVVVDAAVAETGGAAPLVGGSPGRDLSVCRTPAPPGDQPGPAPPSARPGFPHPPS